jgi:hypothetical protein
VSQQEVLTYRLVNGDSMTGVVSERQFYAMERVIYHKGKVDERQAATETVTPCVFHTDEVGDLVEVTTDVGEFPPVTLFMSHVVGIASQGFFDVRDKGEIDEATDADKVTPVGPVAID